MPMLAVLCFVPIALLAMPATVSQKVKDPNNCAGPNCEAHFPCCVGEDWELTGEYQIVYCGPEGQPKQPYSVWKYKSAEFPSVNCWRIVTE
jgi:hypothetical protein